MRSTRGFGFVGTVALAIAVVFGACRPFRIPASVPIHGAELRASASPVVQNSRPETQALVTQCHTTLRLASARARRSLSDHLGVQLLGLTGASIFALAQSQSRMRRAPSEIAGPGHSHRAATVGVIVLGIGAIDNSLNPVVRQARSDAVGALERWERVRRSMNHWEEWGQRVQAQPPDDSVPVEVVARFNDANVVLRDLATACVVDWTRSRE